MRPGRSRKWWKGSGRLEFRQGQAQTGWLNTLAAAVKFIGSLESRRPSPTVTGNVAHGKTLYASCAACHGAKGEGNRTLQAPALAERSDWYLVTQLANYQKGLRGTDARDTYGAQMRAIISTLPDEKAIVDVVAYINTL